MYWNAASFQHLASEIVQLQLAEPFSQVRVDHLLSMGLIGPVVAASRTLINWGTARRRQQKFWDSILAPEELGSYRVVCGGRRAQFADQVRGGIHEKGTYALIDLVKQPILGALCSVAGGLENLSALCSADVANRFERLGDLAKHYSANQVQPPILFASRLSPTSPRLLLPFGGHISNGIVEQQIVETQGMRKYRVVATSATDPTPRELTTHDEVLSLRKEKRQLLDRNPRLDESLVLDPEIRYELWSKQGPVAQPHRESALHGRASDSLYVLFTRRLTALGHTEATLSVQALHPLSLSGMSLFHLPYETLGDQAEEFRDRARRSLQRRNSIGFEAILKVDRRRVGDPPETPRRFDGYPSMSNTTVSVQAMPDPVAP